MRKYTTPLLVCVVTILLGLSSSYRNTLEAQVAADACVAGSAINVRSGAPITFGWVMDKTVPASATDPTPILQRIDGFYYQIDNQPRIEIFPTAGFECVTGFVGTVPYIARTLFGVGKGAHTLSVTAYNFQLDPQDQNTVIKQESAVASIPFVVTDPIQYGPPQPARNLSILR